MPLLKLCTWAAYGLAALFLLAALVTEDWRHLTPGLAAAIGGVLFAALDRIVELLDAIRGALDPAALQDDAPVLEAWSGDDTPLDPAVPQPRSIEELTAAIERLKRANAG